MRITAVACLAVAGCAHGPPITESAISTRSHALIASFDHGDASAFTAMTAPSFVRFEGEKVTTRADMLKHMTRKPPPMTRAWKEEHVYVRDGDATFIGMAIEHETGNDSHGNREYDGWYTVSWVRDGSTWRAVNWTWQAHKTATESARDIWNDNFRQDIGFEHQPNRLLATTIEGVKPGTALDVATGQGRNAVFLATKGWTVTAIDIADEGLRRAREAAAAKHVTLETVQVDADAYDYGTAKWDLVTMIYAGDGDARIRKVAASIRPGGLFVLEFFLDDGDGGIKAGQLDAIFKAGFEIVHDEIVDDRPDWGTDKAKLVRFVARRR